jgi:hypothetical protein
MKRVRRMSENIHKSNSCPEKLDNIISSNPVKNSFSESHLNELIEEVCIPENQIEIAFEGDGPLGILFIEQDNEAFVCGVNSGTVAAEEIDLTIGLKIIKIEEYNCDFISYRDIMDLVLLRWNKYSKLKLRFEKIVEPLNLNTKCPLYQLLETLNCEDYYDCFLELGVKTVEDINFVEYQDLINMKIPTIQRRNFNKVIQLDHKETTHLPKPPSMIFQEPSDPFNEYDYGDLITDDV